MTDKKLKPKGLVNPENFSLVEITKTLNSQLDNLQKSRSDMMDNYIFNMETSQANIDATTEMLKVTVSDLSDLEVRKKISDISVNNYRNMLIRIYPESSHYQINEMVAKKIYEIQSDRGRGQS